MKTFFIGIDGGATKCIIRIEDEYGKLLGTELRGPANIRISVHSAWDFILSGIHAILAEHQIRIDDKENIFHVAVGIAGCEVASSYQDFIHFKQPFNNLIVTSDAHTACLGAHNGEDGAVIIIGTGTIGMSLEEGQIKQVGGYGFPHDDRGGGAYLGLEAVNISLAAHDGRVQPSILSEAIFKHFNDKPDTLITWANQANSTAFASLAPIVIRAESQGDATALKLLQRAADAINEIADALLLKKNKLLPCALIGGLAPFIQNFLSEELKSLLIQPASSPVSGAILLARHAIKNKRKHH